jgi:hypothetical protein
VIEASLLCNVTIVGQRNWHPNGKPATTGTIKATFRAAM